MRSGGTPTRRGRASIWRRARFSTAGPVLNCARVLICGTRLRLWHRFPTGVCIARLWHGFPTWHLCHRFRTGVCTAEMWHRLPVGVCIAQLWDGFPPSTVAPISNRCLPPLQSSATIGRSGLLQHTGRRRAIAPPLRNGIARQTMRVPCHDGAKSKRTRRARPSSRGGATARCADRATHPGPTVEKRCGHRLEIGATTEGWCHN